MGMFTTLFSRAQNPIWDKLAQEFHGQIARGKWGQEKVVIKTNHWMVTLDTWSTGDPNPGNVYTRLRAPYRNLDHFHFSIHRAGLFSPLARLLGLHDLQIGDPAFDKAFVIRGSNEHKVRQFFDDPELKRLLTRQPEVHLSAADDEGDYVDFPLALDELCFMQYGYISHIAELRSAYELFACTLNRLSELGTASPDDPGLTL